MKSQITSAKTSQTGSANTQTPKTTSQLTSRPFAPISKQTTSTPNPHQQQEQTEGLLQRKTNLLEILDFTAQTNVQPGSSEFAQRIKAKGLQQSKGHQKLGISAIQRQPMREEEMQPQESLKTNSSIKEQVDFSTQSIQAKLKIGAPGDKYEQEADALASQVMSLAELESVATKPVNASIQREILPEESLQCKSDRSIQSLDNIETRLNKSKGGGSPLSADIRGFMEPRFGTNLKNVRVHTNSEAVQMSRELSADAFTHGSDIYYGSGKSPGNDHLTAHELTHVMQQTGAVQSKYNLQKTSLVQLTRETKKQKTSGNLSVEELKDIQKKLNKIGAVPRLKIDGIYGLETSVVVRSFQEDHLDAKGKELKVDGRLNDLTKQAIDKASNPSSAPLAADELILTTDPKDANERSLFKFRTQVGGKLGSWRHRFEAYMVQLKPILFGSQEKQAIILKWNTSWGTKPISTHIPYDTMAPIDAKASVASVHKLPGWSKLNSNEQTILNSMLGGETNLLSQKTRDNLRGKLSAMSSYSDTKQEEVLRELITAKDSIPGHINEPITASKVGYSLTGPQEAKNYPFDSKIADADMWKLDFDDNQAKLNFSGIAIFAPKVSEPEHHNHTVQEIAESVSYLPKANRSLIVLITLEPLPDRDDPYLAAKYKKPDFHTYMSADSAGEINVFPEKTTESLENEQFQKTTMIHETGHIWSRQTWGNDTSKGKWLEWQKMIDADKVSVSGYAMANIEEDFGETFAAYVGTKNSPAFDEYRQIVPNRFAMLDKEYK